MTHSSFWLNAADGYSLFVNHWAAVKPRAVIMLSHGMAEHSGRYARLGEALNAQGISLLALDQRGHGRSAESGETGHFADHAGWRKVQSDLALLQQRITELYPNLPIILLGHSMGSYISQAYLQEHSKELHAAILSGSNYQPVWLYQIARLIARFERWRLGRQERSRLINFLSFGSFNKAFKPNRSEFDWLSRDTAEVDRYVNDPLCGFICTTGLWCDLLRGLMQITPISRLARIDSDLPILVIGGSRDPVSQGKRLNDLADALQRAGIAQVDKHIYPEARHELFNELNRDEVTAQLIAWVEHCLSRPRHL